MTRGRAPSEGTGFTPVGVVAEPTATGPRPAVAEGDGEYRARDGYAVVLPAALCDKLVARGRAAAPAEWMGLLVGLRGEDAEGGYARVEAVVPDDDAIATPMHVRTTFESEGRMRRRARESYPGRAILGWVHGHVRVGTHFSGTDRATQRTWSQARSLGIVVDPWAPELFGVYLGPGSMRLAPAPRTALAAASPAGPPPAAPPGDGKRRRRVRGALLAVVALVVALGIRQLAALHTAQAALVHRVDAVEHTLAARAAPAAPLVAAQPRAEAAPDAAPPAAHPPIRRRRPVPAGATVPPGDGGASRAAHAGAFAGESR